MRGEWLVTFKIDGVRAIWDDSLGWQSRAAKPLYNIPPWRPGQPRDCEVFVASFRETIQATRRRLTKADTPVIRPDHLYGLDQLDPRLRGASLIDPTAQAIRAELRRVNALGYEGLVLRQDARWLKVKPQETHDVAITGYAEGRGKHAGRLGFISTAQGDIGAGFSDAERTALWTEAGAGTLIGQIAEIACMQFTPAGQFRHPFFVRMRPDKIAA